MGRKENLTDQIFHRLQVIVRDWYKTKQTGRTYWFCQCEDNNIVSVREDSLKSGHTKSCGCLQKEKVIIICKWCGKERSVSPSLKDTAQFCNNICKGKWMSENIRGKNHPKYKEKEIIICKQCGKEKKVKPSEKDITIFCDVECMGKWFSENIKGENHPQWKEKEIIICKQCGKEKEVNLCEKEKAKFCNPKCYYQWMLENASGKDSPAWKGGITPFYQMIRTSREYKEFTQIILKKANYICQLSNEKSKGDLQVHHIKGFARILEENSITTFKEVLECKELWDEKNVIVLSEKWHLGVKTNNPNAFHRLYGKHNFTEQDFYRWFNKYKIKGVNYG